MLAEALKLMDEVLVETLEHSKSLIELILNSQNQNGKFNELRKPT